MEVERKALYNLMRMNWMQDPTMQVEPWQVEDYRILDLKHLFERLHVHDLQLDKNHFLGLADQVDTPEELTALLLEDSEYEPIVYDQIYLLLFELWRRFITDRPCLSIFCDEFDAQIYLYDNHELDNNESIQDVIATLQKILEENTDKGIDPHDVFRLLMSNCAHDLESFFYDYILDQIENGNEAYAFELIDAFRPYVEDIKWYEFLRTRLLALSQVTATQKNLRLLVEKYADEKDLEFNLEVLTFMVKAGDPEVFAKLVRKTLPLISIEGDLQDLLEICADFYHYLDLEKKEQAIRKILVKRSHFHPEGHVSPQDSARSELLSTL